MISFELIFVYDARCGSKFKLLRMNIQWFWCPLLKRLLLIHWVIFVPLLKAGYPYIYWAVAGPCSVLFICLCVLMPRCLHYCGFITLKIKYCKLSTSFFFFKVVLATLGPLHFHMNFGISLSMCTIKPVGNLTGITLNL